MVQQHRKTLFAVTSNVDDPTSVSAYNVWEALRLAMSRLGRSDRLACVMFDRSVGGGVVVEDRERGEVITVEPALPLLASR